MIDSIIRFETIENNKTGNNFDSMLTGLMRTENDMRKISHSVSMIMLIIIIKKIIAYK